MDISGNIHCVLNNINKIILAQKLETFLMNILNTAGYLIVTKNYQYYVYMTVFGLFSLFNNPSFKPYNLGT